MNECICFVLCFKASSSEERVETQCLLSLSPNLWIFSRFSGLPVVGRTHRLRLKFPTVLVLCVVTASRLGCETESFTLRRQVLNKLLQVGMRCTH